MDNSFPKKWGKYLPTGFEDGVGTMDDEEMKSTIIKCEKTKHTTQKEMDEDPKLNGAKDLVKDYSMAYKDVINTQRAKIQYILHIMEQRGKV